MREPWVTIDRSGDDLSIIPGMIQPIEKQMLFWAARDYFQGLGEIVELGTFLGTSTECLAKGLVENTRVADRAGRIHSYDLFICTPANRAAYGPWLDRCNVNAGDSFLPAVEKHLGTYRDLIQFNPGDILRQSWIGRPIEVLFIDMANNWLLSDHIVRHFFPALMPKHSLIIHQDYLFQQMPWLPITMEYFSDYVEIVGNADCSMAFRLTRPIPNDMLQRGTEGLLPQQKLDLCDRVIRRFGGLTEAGGAILTIHRAALMAMLGDRQGAERLTRDVLNANKHPIVTYRGQGLLDDMPSPNWP